MRIAIESTTKMVTLNSVPCRVWEGITARGVKVVVFIPRIAVKDDQDIRQFEEELVEQKPPSADARVFPARMIL
jgi:hypothetical protein